MKIGILSRHGSTSAYALVMSGVGREIVLVGVNRARAEAEANDICHAAPLPIRGPCAPAITPILPTHR
jgi:L-lactate dehydrogenase